MFASYRPDPGLLTLTLWLAVFLPAISLLVDTDFVTSCLVGEFMWLQHFNRSNHNQHSYNMVGVWMCENVRYSSTFIYTVWFNAAMRIIISLWLQGRPLYDVACSSICEHFVGCLMQYLHSPEFVDGNIVLQSMWCDMMYSVESLFAT